MNNKRENSVVVFETAAGEDYPLPPPWIKEGYYYVLYGVDDWVKKVLTQPFNLPK